MWTSISYTDTLPIVMAPVVHDGEGGRGGVAFYMHVYCIQVQWAASMWTRFGRQCPPPSPFMSVRNDERGLRVQAQKPMYLDREWQRQGWLRTLGGGGLVIAHNEGAGPPASTTHHWIHMWKQRTGAIDGSKSGGGAPAESGGGG